MNGLKNLCFEENIDTYHLKEQFLLMITEYAFNFTVPSDGRKFFFGKKLEKNSSL